LGSSPSIVVTFFPVTAATGVTHERTGWPSTWTVQAPHWATPQPNFVPVRPSFSRMAHRRGMSASASIFSLLPLTVVGIMQASLPESVGGIVWFRVAEATGGAGWGEGECNAMMGVGRQKRKGYTQRDERGLGGSGTG